MNGRWTPTKTAWPTCVRCTIGTWADVADSDSDRLADGVERGRAFVGTISRTPCSTGVQQSRSSGLWLSTWPRGLTNSR